LVSGAFGLFNGVLITRFGFQPIIATLVLFIAGRGIAQVVTNGELQPFRNPAFQYIGLGRVLGIPVQVLVMLAIFAVVAWAVRTTRFGRQVLAIRGNQAAPPPPPGAAAGPGRSAATGPPPASPACPSTGSSWPSTGSAACWPAWPG